MRTDIEELEGRKRFLENRSSLSTINVNIQAPKPAVSDGVGLASDMVLFFEF